MGTALSLSQSLGTRRYDAVIVACKGIALVALGQREDGRAAIAQALGNRGWKKQSA